MRVFKEHLRYTETLLRSRDFVDNQEPFRAQFPVLNEVLKGLVHLYFPHNSGKVRFSLKEAQSDAKGLVIRADRRIERAQEAIEHEQLKAQYETVLAMQKA